LNMSNTDPTQIGNAANCASTLLNPQGNPRSWGVGGMWPEHGAGCNDGLDARSRDAANANGVFALFLGINLGCPGLPLGGLANGALYLKPGSAFVQVAAGELNPTGVGEVEVIPPGVAPPQLVNRIIDFQAFTVGPSFV